MIHTVSISFVVKVLSLAGKWFLFQKTSDHPWDKVIAKNMASLGTWLWMFPMEYEALWRLL